MQTEAPNPAPSIADALALHESGRLSDAERIYRKILTTQPDRFDALHLLGVLLHQGGNHAEAIECIDAALATHPGHIGAWNNRGVVLLELKRFDEALTAFDRVLALKPDHVAALNNRANVLNHLDRPAEALAANDGALALAPEFADAYSTRGRILSALERFEEAVASYDKALALKGDDAVLFNNRGVALMGQRRALAALASYERAIELAPDYADALNNRGTALLRLKRFSEARVDFERALALKPDYADAERNRDLVAAEIKLRDETLAGEADGSAADPETLHRRGLVLIEMRRFAEALACFDQAIAGAPKFTLAFNNRGLVLAELKRFDEALASFDAAIKVDPNNALSYANRGYVLNELKRFDEALASCDVALARSPDHPEALNNRGLAFNGLRRLEEALASFDQALAINPELVEALSNRAVTLKDLKRLDEALASCDRALALDPASAVAHYNRGTTLKAMKRCDEALPAYGRAIAARPDFVEAHWNEALCRLLVGDFAGGWEKYEWRWKTEEAQGTQRDFAQPQWNRESDIRGKTILLHAEQGFGDALQFSRYVGLVAARGANVILEVRPPLKRLLAGIDGAPTIVARGEPLPPFDLHCPLLSLPLAFATRLATIPAPTPLRIPTEQAEKWHARLGRKSGLRVGLVWSGNPAHKNDQNRSLALTLLDPFFDLPVEFVSLQKEVSEEDRMRLAARCIAHYGEELADFSDTAALASLMDLVISVDTSVAHLAASLGLPTWILLPFIPDWRWLLEREDSPWYPTARLFRQREDGDWSDVLGEVLSELRGAADRFGERATAPSYARAEHQATQPIEVALALHRDGRLADAEGGYRRILEDQPDHFDALHLLGVIFHQQGNHAEAVEQIDRALERQPGNAFALNNRGIALVALKRFDQALVSFESATAREPGYAEAYANAADVLTELKRFEEAVQSCDRAVALKPDFAGAHNNRGRALHGLGRFEEALASFDKAIALKPDFADAFNKRGGALDALGRTEDALASFEQAIALDPHDAKLLNNRALVLGELKRFDEALTTYRTATALKPDYGDAHWNQALCLLLTGDFERGLDEYEWRWETDHFRRGKRNFAAPLWSGGEDPAGKRVLLHAEQGFGDTIQFCRYVRLAAARGAHVILEVQPPLRRLLANLEGASAVLAHGEALPQFDLHCPLPSLPRAFATRLETIPALGAPLRAPPELVEQWKARLGPRTKPRVGIAWSGNPGIRYDRHRAIPLHKMQALLNAPVQLVSLHKEARPDDLDVISKNAPDMLHFGPQHTDFLETAALIELMDVVVTVDTAIAHLSCAMGHPTFILLPFVPDWRWLLDREDSPWYPNARLFRQPRPGNWDDVLERLVDELQRNLSV
jgi:tetratricopeptide (TPR) repeat protein